MSAYEITQKRLYIVLFARQSSRIYRLFFVTQLLDELNIIYFRKIVNNILPSSVNLILYLQEKYYYDTI